MNHRFLEIRNYQQQLYEDATKENSIIYLETGTGKTLITVMLVWHYLCKEPNKKVVFLANNISLVE